MHIQKPADPSSFRALSTTGFSEVIVHNETNGGRQHTHTLRRTLNERCDFLRHWSRQILDDPQGRASIGIFEAHIDAGLQQTPHYVHFAAQGRLVKGRSCSRRQRNGETGFEQHVHHAPTANKWPKRPTFNLGSSGGRIFGRLDGQRGAISILVTGRPLNPILAVVPVAVAAGCVQRGDAERTDALRQAGFVRLDQFRMFLQ